MGQFGHGGDRMDRILSTGVRTVIRALKRRNILAIALEK